MADYTCESCNTSKNEESINFTDELKTYCDDCGLPA